MKRLALRCAVALLVLASMLMSAPIAGASSHLAPLLRVNGKIVPNSFIVVFKPGTATSAAVTATGVRADYVYDAALNGFAATLNASQVSALQRNPNVAYIEPNQTASIDTTQIGATWGLDRIDQRYLPLSGSYTYTSTGAGVYAYIIDTGIQTSHAQFGGRAAVSYDALGGSGQDCNGHGTHVAGTVGSTTYGVAKRVYLRAVRVLNCAGSGTWAQVIAGMNWVRVNHANPSVANMSLSGAYSLSVNTAATNLVNSGVFLAVAAGNWNANACNYSPASAPGTITVGATDRNDARAPFSNYGGCVDIYAPGVGITSTWTGSGTNTISGTSMASPHVAGVGVLYKATYGNVAAATIISWMTTNATLIYPPPPYKLLYKSTL